MYMQFYYLCYVCEYILYMCRYKLKTIKDSTDVECMIAKADSNYKSNFAYNL